MWFLFALPLGILLAELVLRLRALALGQKNASLFGAFPVADNVYFAALDSGKRSFADFLLPHPHLGYVLRPGLVYTLAKVSGNQPTINDDGFMDAPWPARHDSGHYTILVTGGSVAALLLLNAEVAFQRTMNTRYTAADGRPVRILNGAIGGWKQPQQLVLSQLMSERIDAVVTIEGYNEMSAIRGGAHRYRLDYNNWIQRILLQLENNTSKLLWRTTSGAVTRFVSGYAPLRVSYLANTLAMLLARKAMTQDPDERLESPWRLPADMSAEDRLATSISDYRRYLLLMGRGAAALKLPFVAFLQPCPAIGKTLSETEKGLVGDLSYAPIYQRVCDTLMALGEEGLQIFDLGDAFAATTEQIYLDKVHPNTRGNAILAERIMATLERQFGLRRKPGTVGQ